MGRFRIILVLTIVTSATAFAAEECHFSKVLVADQSFTKEKWLLLKEKNPEAFASLISKNPEFSVVVKDAEFESLLKSGLTDSQAIAKLYPSDYEKGALEFAQYLRRKEWRAKYKGDPRPLPSYPGGPRLTSVDRYSEEVHLPPVGKKNVRQQKVSLKGNDYQMFYEPDNEMVNVYDSTGARVGLFEFTIYDYGSYESLKVKMIAIDGSEKGKGLGGVLYDYVLGMMPEIKKIEGNLAFDNAKAFWSEYQKTQDYFKAVRATPSYKQRAQRGFSVIDPPPQDWLPSEFDVRNQIPLVTSRP